MWGNEKLLTFFGGVRGRRRGVGGSDGSVGVSRTGVLVREGRVLYR